MIEPVFTVVAIIRRGLLHHVVRVQPERDYHMRDESIGFDISGCPEVRIVERHFVATAEYDAKVARSKAEVGRTLGQAALKFID